MKQILTTISALCLAMVLGAQSSASFWTDASSAPLAASGENVPTSYRKLALDINAMAGLIRQAPMENTEAARTSPLILSLPMPDGRMENFAVWEAPIMAKELATAYPMIKTYAGRSIENPNNRMRIHLSPLGFNAIFLTTAGTAHIAPLAEGQTEYYMSFYLKDIEVNLENLPLEMCGVHSANWDGMGLDPAHFPSDQSIELNGERGVGSVAVDNQKYRLAVATTAEFSNAHGGNVTSVLNQVTLLMNNVNMVMEGENAITLELIPTTTQAFFFPPNNSDPYTNGNTGAMIDQNPPALNAAVGSSSYDIGHVFGTNAGGLASTGSVCGNADNKGRGVSCEFGAYSGLPFYLIIAHEMGHQFNALHTFNLCDMENESTETAYEPGSGSTIMCYAGASDCGPNYVQNMDDNYYHINSLIRIQQFSRDNTSGGACDQLTAIGNNSPEASIALVDGFYIPISTPFQLTGAATDPDGDPMTYCWEQYDKGPQSTLGTPIGTAPLFRSRLPTTSLTRVLPRIETIIANSTDKTEVLPTITRPITFRFTARDNNAPAGAWGYAEVKFNATETAGPFVVTNPNTTGITWEVGDYKEVTWNVANTTNNLVNCQFVNIKLSTDGGFTYPVTLLAQTPNDGSAFVVVPDEITTTARVRVEAADNIFFDISNNNFSIVAPAEPGFALVQNIEFGTACIPDDFEVELETTALLGFSGEITFSASDLPPGATASFSPNPVTPGGSTTLVLDMSNVTVDGTYNITITASANGLADQERVVSINVVNNDFSAMMLTGPADGASAQSLLPSFQWSALPNAHTYDIEIATSPTFGNTVVADSFGLTVTTYVPDITLQENTLYYWRIRSNNECGAGQYSDAATFITVAQSCTTYPSTNAPIAISPAGLPYITSKVMVPQSILVSDVNLKNVNGVFDSFGDLGFRLKSPNGDSVVIMNGASLSCFLNLPFDLGFDDQSPTAIPCPPPTNGSFFKPHNPLSAFIGTNGQGEWTFVLKVLDSFGSQGGTFDSWALELCGAASPNDPVLLKNDTICSQPNGQGLIYLENLQVEDPDNTPPQLVFHIVTAPSKGYISRDGIQLGTGGTFTMQDVYDFKVYYNNTNASATNDYFTFAVTDGTGGLLGTPKADVKIDPNCVVGTSETLGSNDFQVYPNPASGQVNISFSKADLGKTKVSLLTVDGKLLLEKDGGNAGANVQLNTSGLAAGLYIVQVKTEAGVFSKKVVLE